MNFIDKNYTVFKIRKNKSEFKNKIHKIRMFTV